jgi:hypothetical protein
MSNRGGYRPGGGRPRKVDELKIINIAHDAIVKHYGSLEEGFLALLGSGEPALIKYVFDHCCGKPRERVNIDVEGTMNTVQLIRLPDNGRDDINLTMVSRPTDTTEDTEVIE